MSKRYGHDNGAMPTDTLRTVGGVRLYKPTATATERLIAAAEADGKDMPIFKPVGGYRSLATQKNMTAAVKAGHPEKYNIRPGVSLKPPGFQTHGWGDCVDFAGDPNWLHAHAADYGFTWSLGASDASHWQHDGHTLGPDISTAGTGGQTIVTAPESTEESLVKIAIIQTGNRYDARLINFATGTWSEPLGDATLAGLRNGKAKGKGPLGDEFQWTDDQFAREQKYVLLPTQAQVRALLTS